MSDYLDLTNLISSLFNGRNILFFLNKIHDSEISLLFTELKNIKVHTSAMRSNRTDWGRGVGRKGNSTTFTQTNSQTHALADTLHHQ